MTRSLLSLLIGGAMSLLALLRPAAAETVIIKLSGGAKTVIKSLEATRGAATSESGAQADPAVIVVDVSTLGIEDTAKVLTAIDDVRRGGGLTYAICPASEIGIKEGAAIIALACDAVLFVKGAEIKGCYSGWCSNASRRATMASTFTRLSRLPAPLAKRFWESESALSWSAKSGFTADETGGVKLAAAGKPLQVGAAKLKSIGVAATEIGTLEGAIAAIESGVARPRAQPTEDGLVQNDGVGGAGSTEKPTVAEPPQVAPSAKPSAPQSRSPPSPPRASVDAQLAPKLAEYGATLTELQQTLKEFDDYFYGRKGRWTSEHEGLKWVWQDGSDHTGDPDTKVICQRLQRDIKTKMSLLESLAKAVERIAKDKSHPDVQRLQSHKTVLDGLRIGIERNKVSNYESYYKSVLSLR